MYHCINTLTQEIVFVKPNLWITKIRLRIPSHFYIQIIYRSESASGLFASLETVAVRLNRAWFLLAQRGRSRPASRRLTHHPATLYRKAHHGQMGSGILEGVANAHAIPVGFARPGTDDQDDVVFLHRQVITAADLAAELFLHRGEYPQRLRHRFNHPNENVRALHRETDRIFGCFGHELEAARRLQVVGVKHQKHFAHPTLQEHTRCHDLTT